MGAAGGRDQSVYGAEGGGGGGGVAEDEYGEVEEECVEGMGEGGGEGGGGVVGWDLGGFGLDWVCEGGWIERFWVRGFLSSRSKLIG